MSLPDQRLATISAEFDAAQERLHRLPQQIPADRWPVRKDPLRWSVAECVAHLNLTSQAYLPLLEAAVPEARVLPRPGPAAYRRDLVGWLLWRSLGPPVRIRMKTPAAFVPTGTQSPADLIASFDVLQAAQLALLHAAEGTAIDRVKLRSPFNASMSYNLYSCFSLLPRHQQRHLWQAEQLWR